LHTSGISPQLGFVSAGDAVPQFFVFTSGDGGGGNVDGVEMIHKALSSMAVELEPLVEVFLFEDDAIVDASHIA